MTAEPRGLPAAGPPGRPRSEALTRRVRAAAREAFARRGFAAVTMAEIASAAGVGLDSIYRRWPAKQALLVDVVAAAVAEDVAVPDTGSAIGDLTALVRALVQTMQADLGLLLTAAIAESARDPKLAEQLATAQKQRRSATAAVVHRGVARGELRADTDPDVLLDVLAGVVWQRLWLGAEPVRPEDVRPLVDAVLAGFAVAPGGR